jgi:hypothetical protein
MYIVFMGQGAPMPFNPAHVCKDLPHLPSTIHEDQPNLSKQECLFCASHSPVGPDP